MGPDARVPNGALFGPVRPVALRSYGLTNIVMVLMDACVRHPSPRPSYIWVSGGRGPECFSSLHVIMIATPLI